MGLLMTAGAQKPDPMNGDMAAAPSDAEIAGGMQAEPGGSADVGEIEKRAFKYAYGEKFDTLLAMFKENGAENFAKSMAVAVNGALKNAGEMTHEQAAEVGMKLYLALLEDIITSDVVPGITAEQVSQALPMTLRMYAESHPDVSEQDMQALMTEIEKRAKGAVAGG